MSMVYATCTFIALSCCLAISGLIVCTLRAEAGGIPPETPKVERVEPLDVDPLRDAPGVFFHEDLETIGNLRERFHDVGESDDRFRISNADAFSGKRAIQQIYLPLNRMPGDPGAAGWCWRFFGDNPRTEGIRDRRKHRTAVARWYHKYEDGFTPRDGVRFPQKMARMRCFTSGEWHGAYTVLYWTSGDDAHISIERHTRAPDAHREWLPNLAAEWRFSSPQNVGRWIHFELRVALGRGQRADRVQAWADGVLICDVTGDDLAAGYDEFTLNGMSWDCYWNDGSPAEQSRFFDDLMLSDEPIGPARTGPIPVVRKSAFRSRDASARQAGWQVEIAQGAQKPLAAARTFDGAVTRHEPPAFDYAVVWRGTVTGGGNDVVVDAENGKFTGPLAGKDRLSENALHFVRLRQQDSAGRWSIWSAWHAGFATTWPDGTPPEGRTPPRGYRLDAISPKIEN